MTPAAASTAAPRIHAELRMEHNIRVGRKRVARLMKAAGISGVRPRKRWKTTIRVPGGRARHRPRRTPIPPHFTEPGVGRGHHLAADRGGLAVPRRGTGRLLAPDRRLVDGHPHALDAGRRRAQDGARPPAPRARADPSLRPRLAVREPRVRARRASGRDRDLDGLPRRTPTTTRSPKRSSRHSRRSSSTAAAGHRGSSSSPRCSTTSRRSTTAAAATPRSAWSPRLSIEQTQTIDKSIKIKQPTT